MAEVNQSWRVKEATDEVLVRQPSRGEPGNESGVELNGSVGCPVLRAREKEKQKQQARGGRWEALEKEKLQLTVPED